MLCRAASQLGVHVRILASERSCPAQSAATETLEGEWNDPEALQAFASGMDVVTFENEFVDWKIIAELEASGVPCVPNAETLRRAQDKGLQKTSLRDGRLAVPRFALVDTLEQARAAASEFEWQVVLKARRDGYDGRGNFTARSESELLEGWRRFEGRSGGLLVEEFYPFERELAVIVVTGRNGERREYPTVQSVQRDHICHETIYPAPISSDVQARAQRLARAAVDTFGGQGVFGVELFMKANGDLAVNELAPRVHNSGHYTIEGAECSQFENHVRAILGLPIGSTSVRAPVVVMRNLLGDGDGTEWPLDGWLNALATPGVGAHMYGKREARKGRKMGHLTAYGEEMEEVRGRIQSAYDRIRFAS